MAPTPTRKRKEAEIAPNEPSASLTSPAQGKMTREQRQAIRNRARRSMDRDGTQLAKLLNAGKEQAHDEDTIVSPIKKRRVSLAKSEAIQPAAAAPSVAATTTAAPWAPPRESSSKPLLTKKEQRQKEFEKAVRATEREAAISAKTNAPSAPRFSPSPQARRYPEAPVVAAAQNHFRISPPAVASPSFLSPPAAQQRRPFITSPSISESPDSEDSASPARGPPETTANTVPGSSYYDPSTVADSRPYSHATVVREQQHAFLQPSSLTEPRDAPSQHHRPFIPSPSVDSENSVSPPGRHSEATVNHVPGSLYYNAPHVAVSHPQPCSDELNVHERQYTYTRPSSLAESHVALPQQQQQPSYCSTTTAQYQTPYSVAPAPSHTKNINNAPFGSSSQYHTSLLKVPSAPKSCINPDTNVVQPSAMTYSTQPSITRTKPADNTPPVMNAKPKVLTSNEPQAPKYPMPTRYSEIRTTLPALAKRRQTTASPTLNQTAASPRSRFGSPAEQQRRSSSKQSEEVSPLLHRLQEQVEGYSTSSNVGSLAHDLNMVEQEKPQTESSMSTSQPSKAIISEKPQQPDVFSFCVAIFAIAMVCLFSFTNEEMLARLGNATSVPLPPSLSPPCFVNSEGAFEGPTDVAVCMQPDLPCPLGGFCQYSLLQSCLHRHREVSPTTDACILTKEANETLVAAENVLSTWTVQHVCSADGCPFVVAVPDESATVRPWFHFSQLMGELDCEWDLDLFQQVPKKFSIYNENDLLLIGLSNDYIENSLPVPLWCMVQKWIAGCLKMLVHSILSILGLVVFGSFRLVVAYPLQSVCVMTVTGIFVYVVRLRSEQGRLRTNVAKARRMAYQKLQDAAPAIVPVLHIRDELAWELYPNGGDEQRYLKTKVWARVFKDLEQDNRIGKETRVVDRKQERTWQWLAVTPKKY